MSSRQSDCTLPPTRTLVGTISPEPEVVIFECPDAYLMAEYMMLRLLWKSTPITDKVQFYGNIGVEWSSSWIPYILQHPNLLHPIKCNYVYLTLIERLAVELKIGLFEVLHFFPGAMFVDNDSTLKLKNSQEISDELISKMVFEMNFGEGERHTIQAGSVPTFKLQCGPLTNSIADSLKMNVFCRAKDRSFDLVKIHSLFLNHYDFHRNEPLIISESIGVPPFNPNVGIGGSLTINSSSNIAIIDDGSITANPSRSQCDDMKFRVGITLLSQSSIINEGVLSHNERQRETRIICLIAPSVINRGVIRCDSDDDKIIIICNEFQNAGSIAVGKKKNNRVRVEKMSTEQVAKVLDLMDSKRVSEMGGKRGEKQMKLEYEKHSGHYSARWTSCHPRNLLEEGTGKGYISANVGAVGEWMIFRLQSEERVFPTKIGIRNREDGNRLKTISISGSADNEQFEEWIMYKNIDRNWNEELQIFDINPLDGLVALSGRFKFFMIKMEDRYSYLSIGRGREISFYEFRIYGIVTD